MSPLPQRPTEDVTPLHVLSDSIAVDQSCLDSVQTEARKDGTLQQPRNCQATQSTRCSQQQLEGLAQYEVPAGPWKRLGIDYFKWNQQRYLLIADYYSRFPIIRSVSTMSAAHLVTVLKTIFSEYGLPEELVSDQGTQFTSEQYTSFEEEYNIKITHCRPRYPQSNGFIESMVKITKQILQRCKQTSSDPHMAMLLYRATPLQSGMASPAELLSHEGIKQRYPSRTENQLEVGTIVRLWQSRGTSEKDTSTRRQQIIGNYRCTNQSMCSSTLTRQHGRRQTSLERPQKSTRGATRSNYQPGNASPGIVATYGQIVEQHLMTMNQIR